VSLGWDDVEAILNAFAEKGHIGALQLNNAKKLAEAVGKVVSN
jgi:hypothetical protein